MPSFDGYGTGIESRKCQASFGSWSQQASPKEWDVWEEWDILTIHLQGILPQTTREKM